MYSYHVDCVTSVDERIRSYMTYQDWRDELHEAGEEQWTVNQTKFDYSNIVQEYSLVRRPHCFD